MLPPRRLVSFMLRSCCIFLVRAPAFAADSLPVYVTRQDCHQLVAHHPDPDVAYQPGRDLHGHAVVPADLPGSQMPGLLTDRFSFDLKVNPLAYGGDAASADAAGSKVANTAMTVAHIEVDMLSGSVKINGHALEDEQTRLVTEACRQAGYR
jgi:hypothetical protein